MHMKIPKEKKFIIPLVVLVVLILIAGFVLMILTHKEELLLSPEKLKEVNYNNYIFYYNYNSKKISRLLIL